MSDRTSRTLSQNRPTMRHVAALAGVGIKTVSRVMNDEPGVSEATRQKVLGASQQLNYQLDMAAGSLRRAGRRTLSVGLLLPSVSNPFSGEIHRAMEDALAARGIAVFAASLDDDPQREKAIVAAFLGRRVDGLVLTPIAQSQAYVIPEHSRDLPMVFIDREPVGMEADAVVTDNAVGAARAAAHLMARATPSLPIWGTAPTSRPPGNAGGGSSRRSAGRHSHLNGSCPRRPSRRGVGEAGRAWNFSRPRNRQLRSSPARTSSLSAPCAR